jgi:hypothetical protein
MKIMTFTEVFEIEKNVHLCEHSYYFVRKVSDLVLSFCCNLMDVKEACMHEATEPSFCMLGFFTACQ